MSQSCGCIRTAPSKERIPSAGVTRCLGDIVREGVFSDDHVEDGRWNTLLRDICLANDQKWENNSARRAFVAKDRFHFEWGKVMRRCS
jgi:hypothetical protein